MAPKIPNLSCKKTAEALEESFPEEFACIKKYKHYSIPNERLYKTIPLGRQRAAYIFRFTDSNILAIRILCNRGAKTKFLDTIDYLENKDLSNDFWAVEVSEEEDVVLSYWSRSVKTGNLVQYDRNGDILQVLFPDPNKMGFFYQPSKTITRNCPSPLKFGVCPRLNKLDGSSSPITTYTPVLLSPTGTIFQLPDEFATTFKKIDCVSFPKSCKLLLVCRTVSVFEEGGTYDDRNCRRCTWVLRPDGVVMSCCSSPFLDIWKVTTSSHAVIEREDSCAQLVSLSNGTVDLVIEKPSGYRCLMATDEMLIFDWVGTLLVETAQLEIRKSHSPEEVKKRLNIIFAYIGHIKSLQRDESSAMDITTTTATTTTTSTTTDTKRKGSLDEAIEDYEKSSKFECSSDYPQPDKAFLYKLFPSVKSVVVDTSRNMLELQYFILTGRNSIREGFTF